jgi:DNA mismatch repair protein MutS2
MLYPHDIEYKLGFDKIRELLRKRCSGEQGQRNVDKIRFSSNKDLILKLCRQTEEFMNMIAAGEQLPSLNYPETRDILKKFMCRAFFSNPWKLQTCSSL